jgi:hypothetical protein
VVDLLGLSAASHREPDHKGSLTDDHEQVTAEVEPRFQPLSCLRTAAPASAQSYRPGATGWMVVPAEKPHLVVGVQQGSRHKIRGLDHGFALEVEANDP